MDRAFFYLKGNGGEAGIALRPLGRESKYWGLTRPPSEARRRKPLRSGPILQRDDSLEKLWPTAPSEVHSPNH